MEFQLFSWDVIFVFVRFRMPLHWRVDSLVGSYDKHIEKLVKLWLNWSRQGWPLHRDALATWLVLWPGRQRCERTGSVVLRQLQNLSNYLHMFFQGLTKIKTILCGIRIYSCEFLRNVLNYSKEECLLPWMVMSFWNPSNPCNKHFNFNRDIGWYWFLCHNIEIN